MVVQSGALRQASEANHATQALAGNAAWTDYTLTLKARKIAGFEGFRILFHHQDDADLPRWNLGAPANARALLESENLSDGVDLSIESGRWYDVKIELRGTLVKCYLDDRFIQQLAIPTPSTKTLFASATRDEKTGDIIVKVVNAAAAPLETEVDLAGAGELPGTGQAIVLTSANPKDENTLDEPAKVAPKAAPLKFTGSKFTRAFPGNSLTILRIESNPLLHPARIRIRKSLHARTDRRHFASKEKPPSGLADGGLSE